MIIVTVCFIMIQLLIGIFTGFFFWKRNTRFNLKEIKFLSVMLPVISWLMYSYFKVHISLIEYKTEPIIIIGIGLVAIFVGITIGETIKSDINKKILNRLNNSKKEILIKLDSIVNYINQKTFNNNPEDIIFLHNTIHSVNIQLNKIINKTEDPVIIKRITRIKVMINELTEISNAITINKSDCAKDLILEVFKEYSFKINQLSYNTLNQTEVLLENNQNRPLYLRPRIALFSTMHN